MAIVTQIGTVLSSVISWFGTVLTALVGENGALEDLLPIFCISIGIALVFTAVRAIRALCYGA